MIRAEKPTAVLQQFVRRYVELESRFPAQAFIQPIAARTEVAIDFILGDPYEAWSADQSKHETTRPVAVIGAQTYRRIDLALQGHVHEFVILFQPGGFSRLFSVPPDELTNRDFDGRAVLGRCVDDLRCRLGEAESFAERIRAADRYLLARVPHHAHSGVIAAARELQQHRGSLRISSLADKAGLSLRQFERRFISEVGMSPKLYARVARFEAALEIKLRAADLRWIDIAHDLGYHDQMHLVRDFRQFSDSTPSDLAPRVGLAVAPEIDGTR